MSIREEWQKLVAARQLHELRPFDGDPYKRVVIMTDEVAQLVFGPWNNDLMGDRCARLAANLQNIVTGAKLVVCMRPFEARVAQLGRLDPVEDSVWDFRDSEKPGLRVFVQFLERDVLFASTCRPRSVRVNWLDYLPLGDRNSKEWKDGIRAAKRQWTMFFPAHEPVKGVVLDEYLSNADHEGIGRGA
jgi:hypothetical protein